jgi:hypothetical protein
MDQLNDELQAKVNALMNSKTLHSLIDFADLFSINYNDPNELKANFGIAGMQLIDALDNHRITFINTDDEAHFMGLLTIIIDYAMDGNLKQNA